MQQAFVFAKPHANKGDVIDLIKKTFDEKGISVLKEGSMTGPEIDQGKFIDEHYYAIASKATMKEPSELNIPKDKFHDKFGEKWDDVLSAGRALNAMDAKKKLNVSADELDAIWGAAKKADRLIKFGGGFYCGYLKDHDLYTFNAFFMTMRGKFCDDDATIHYFVVEYDSKALSWADFRGKVLGPTDPDLAPKDSLRGMIGERWKELGLTAPCNTGDNAVHASASPFEGLAEKQNWLKIAIADDDFGKDLINGGVPEATIKEWCRDPQVVINPDGKKGSLFDQVEDLDRAECLTKLVDIYKLQ